MFVLGGVFDDPKTMASLRTIPLPDAVRRQHAGSTMNASRPDHSGNGEPAIATRLCGCAHLSWRARRKVAVRSVIT